MKFLFLILLILSNPSFSKEDTGLGKWHLGLDVGITENLKNASEYESVNKVEDYSFKLGKTININSLFDIDGYVGYSKNKTIINYQNRIDSPLNYKNDSAFFQINPLIKVFDSAYFGAYMKNYLKHQKMTDTEMYVTKFGLNTQLQTNPNGNLRAGFFYEETNGTTSKKLQSGGISIQINW